jgi:hypothetical protein
MKTFREFILECELVEGIQPLPREKMLGKVSNKEGDAKSSFKKYKLYKKGISSSMGMREKRNAKTEIKKTASQIKKIKSKLRTHDPLDSRFKELENRDRGEKKSKTKLEKDYELSSDGKYRKRSRVK